MTHRLFATLLISSCLNLFPAAEEPQGPSISNPIVSVSNFDWTEADKLDWRFKLKAWGPFGADAISLYNTQLRNLVFVPDVDTKKILHSYDQAFNEAHSDLSRYMSGTPSKTVFEELKKTAFSPIVTPLKIGSLKFIMTRFGYDFSSRPHELTSFEKRPKEEQKLIQLGNRTKHELCRAFEEAPDETSRKAIASVITEAIEWSARFGKEKLVTAK